MLPSRRWRWLRKHPTLIIGALLLIAVAVISLAAPWIATHDPQDLDPIARMQGPSAEHYFGTDALGRDVFSRAIWGGQVSLIVGIAVATLATFAGVVLGLTAGFVRWADGPVMRVMDGLMAIPGILLAIALMAVTQASLTTVIVAITDSRDSPRRAAGALARAHLARAAVRRGRPRRRHPSAEQYVSPLFFFFVLASFRLVLLAKSKGFMEIESRSMGISIVHTY